MNSVVEDLFTVTEKLHSLLLQPLPKEDDQRDGYIDEVEKLLSERQALIPALGRVTLTAEDKEKGRELVALNQEIEQRLADKQKQIKTDINNFKLKQKQNRKYDNPYDGPTLEGAFFDKRSI
ncbi:flagellar protein [Alkalihalobacterium chitinilyticum]|uniref:Flagellar protein FliT n=1 Tax=Alkalihalobacterium chitinilyticum TaxID=2980103 RepID=A0ABT5VF08_9BACI|nr:flagellar protein [Alkalihalobacterium chitinilyticum]MDE5414053.1 flagellar protein [Alkalihalobacterium chitinilyticum]